MLVGGNQGKEPSSRIAFLMETPVKEAEHQRIGGEAPIRVVNKEKQGRTQRSSSEKKGLLR